jgi:hypothetical protein
MDDVVECLIEDVAGLSWSANTLRGTMLGRQQIEKRGASLPTLRWFLKAGNSPELLFPSNHPFWPSDLLFQSG